MRRGAWGLGVLFVFFETSAALAQVAGQSGQSYSVQVQLAAEHDGNIARASEALAAKEKITLDDTTYTPTLSINFVKPIGRQSIFFDGSISYLFHQNNKSLDSERVNVGTGISLQAGPCGVSFTGGYARGRSQLADPTRLTGIPSPIAGYPGLPSSATGAAGSTIFNISTSEQVGASATCARPSGIGITTQVNESWASNTEVFSSTGRYRTFAASGGLSYQRPLFGALSLVGTYSETKNGDQLVGVPAASGFETVGGNLSYSRRLGGRIQASATVGYTDARTLSPPVILGAPAAPSDFKGVTYSANATYRATSRLNASLSLQKGISPSILAGNSYEVQSGYTVGLNYQIGSRISVALNDSRQESRTTGAVAIIPGATPLTDSRVNSLSASVSYSMSRRLSFQFSATRETRASDSPEFDYTNDRVAFTLSSHFP